MDVDPELAGLIEVFPTRRVDWAAATPFDVPRIREAIAAAARSASPPPVASGTAVQDIEADVPGEGRVRVRVHRREGPRGPAPAPGLVWIHGGGFILGSALAPDARVERWVVELGLVVVSVDYRLAPEYPYPAPLEDCAVAWEWACRHAAELGIDPVRLGVGGGSAGAGLAAALSLRLRDRGPAVPAFQLLHYPMLDHRTGHGAVVEDPIWPAAANRLGWACYLGKDGTAAEVPAHASPALADDLSRLPPTGIFVGGADLFCQEDLAFATRLLEAGVSVDLGVYAGAPHGFDGFAQTDVAKRCRRDMTDFLRRVTRQASPTRNAGSGEPGFPSEQTP
ncbi:alpha/beta hydrolase [Streptomyces sp. NPDC005811]|uniref:alpha/beta hydrolase n=1 Tax=Streptomyces sp. NPDC005811 TaxID=3154565 RepID=UPI00340E962F